MNFFNLKSNLVKFIFSFVFVAIFGSSSALAESTLGPSDNENSASNTVEMEIVNTKCKKCKNNWNGPIFAETVPNKDKVVQGTNKPNENEN